MSVRELMALTLCVFWSVVSASGCAWWGSSPSAARQQGGSTGSSEIPGDVQGAGAQEGGVAGSDASQPLLWTVVEERFVVLDGLAREVDAFGLGFEVEALVASPRERAAYLLTRDGVLSRVDVAERRVVPLARPAPRPSCLDDSEYPLELQSQRDFWRTTDDALCVHLMDRNANMADVGLSLRYALPGGPWTQRVSFAPDDGDCDVSPMASPLCTAPTSPMEPPRPPSVGVDEAQCALVSLEQRGDAVVIPAESPAECELSVVGATPSGRFIGVTTYFDSSDYIYLTFHLVDWERRALVEGINLTIVGETAIRWSSDAEALLVGEELILLGGPSPIVRRVGLATAFIR